MIPYDDGYVPWREAARWRRLFVASLALNLLLLTLCAFVLSRHS